MANKQVAVVNKCEAIERLLAKVQETKQIKRDWEYEGTWLRAGTVHYTAPDGSPKTWEMVERTSHGRTCVDGTEVIGSCTIGA